MYCRYADYYFCVMVYKFKAIPNVEKTTAKNVPSSMLRFIIDSRGGRGTGVFCISFVTTSVVIF